MTQYPPPVLPNTLGYDIIFIDVLAVVLVLIVLFPILRKYCFAGILIPIGYYELNILINSRYSPPLEPMGLVYATIASGIILFIFSLIRPIFNFKGIKLFLIFSGCIELIIAAISLLNLNIVGVPYINGFLIINFNYELFLRGTVLIPLAIYSLVVGAFLFVTNITRKMAGKKI